MEIKTVFLIGKPGSGKGTQAKLLAEHTGWTAYSSGGLFRSIGAEDTPVGRKVKEEIDNGILAPHWFAMYLFLKTLFSVPDNRGIIFDGFCRKVPEAELDIDALGWLGRPFKVLNIRISDETVEKRLALRKEIENRVDDSAVDERLKEYREHTEPALEVFRKAGVLLDIDGEPSPEVIAEEIKQVLKL